jgi:hypothetical protein
MQTLKLQPHASQFSLSDLPESQVGFGVDALQQQLGTNETVFFSLCDPQLPIIFG